MLNKEIDKEIKLIVYILLGICWVQMLQNINHDALEEAGNLLIEWMRTEIAAFDKGVYSLVDARIEPANYDYLPNKSIVRGLANYVRLAIVSIPVHLLKDSILRRVHTSAYLRARTQYAQVCTRPYALLHKGNLMKIFSYQNQTRNFMNMLYDNVYGFWVNNIVNHCHR